MTSDNSKLPIMNEQMTHHLENVITNIYPAILAGIDNNIGKPSISTIFCPSQLQQEISSRNLLLDFDSKTSFSTIIKDIFNKRPNLLDPILQSIGITQQEMIDNVDAGFLAVCNEMKISQNGLINNALISMAMSEDDVLKTTNLLINGLKPNIKIRRNKCLVHLCRSIEMLELLLSHNLDLSINKPLLWVPDRVFLYMIKEYKLDPYEYYCDFKEKNKIKYINKMLQRDRKTLHKSLGRFLLPVLTSIVINMCYHVPTISQ